MSVLEIKNYSKIYSGTKKAADDIKTEIVDVSMLISEKMIGRELKEEDHRELIDSFIDNIGNGDD